MRAKMKSNLEEVNTRKVALVLTSVSQQTQGLHKELDGEIERMAAESQVVTVPLYVWIQAFHNQVGGRIEETELHLRVSNR